MHKIDKIGSIAYDPPAGTFFSAGSHEINCTFAPYLDFINDYAIVDVQMDVGP
jgi:hypothetical protein